MCAHITRPPVALAVLTKERKLSLLHQVLQQLFFETGSKKEQAKNVRMWLQSEMTLVRFKVPVLLLLLLLPVEKAEAETCVVWHVRNRKGVTALMLRVHRDHFKNEEIHKK